MGCSTAFKHNPLISAYNSIQHGAAIGANYKPGARVKSLTEKSLC